MELPKEFFTIASLGTLAGASGAVWFITGALGHLLDEQLTAKASRWIGFVASFVVTFGAVLFVAEKGAAQWVVAGLNGFMVYCTAMGVNSLASKGNHQPPTPPSPIPTTTVLGADTSGSDKKASGASGPGTTISRAPVSRPKSGRRSPFTQPWW